MTRSQADCQIQELRAIELIARATDAVEKWSRNEKKIGKKPLSIDKKERAVVLSKTLLRLCKLTIPDMLIEVVIESTCLYHDNVLQEETPLPDPTIDDEDEDE
jgi:hypothetical protein